jgi:hypothetical protein
MGLHGIVLRRSVAQGGPPGFSAGRWHRVSLAMGETVGDGDMSGLLALLDDVAAIAKVAAASVDDIAGAAAKAGAKAAGVVIDDAAVTPKYVTWLRRRGNCRSSGASRWGRCATSW